MYKIYINENPLYLVSDIQDLQKKGIESNTYRYLGKAHEMIKFIDQLEKSSKKAICLYSNDIETLWHDFQSLFKNIHAAGGIVKNEEDILMIYRLKMWDLPKGKVEKNEGLEQAALREITEETGLEKVEICEKVGMSYHTYRLKSGKRVLKHNHWYLVESRNRNFTPQEEEGITEGLWLTLEDARNLRAYRSIKDVLSRYKSQL